MKYITIFICSILLTSCGHKHDEGHIHDAEGNHIPNATADEVPRVDYTLWSPKTELFVEFPVLVVGKQSRFAAHFTKMNRHQAVTEGEVTVSLLQGFKGIRQKAKTPSSPGIFTPTLEPIQAGKGTLMFVLITKDYTDTLTITDVQIYPDLKSAQDENPTAEEDCSGITFLKEQAWKMPFQTEQVRSKDVYETISTSGKWEIAPNNSQSLIAGANGKVSFVKSNLIPGKKVSKGEVIMSVSSKGFVTNNLSGDLQVAKIDYEQAKAEYERKKDLYNDRIVPKSEFELVEQKYLVAKSKYETRKNGISSSGYSSTTKRVTVPISGYLREVNVTNGSFVQEGDLLFTISASNSDVLNIQVPVEYADKLNSIQNIWYKTTNGQWENMNHNNGSILSIDKTTSDQKPTISIYANVNSLEANPQGKFTEVNIAFGNGENGIVIPKSALLEDYGNYSVIVQLSGESFERRNVVIGKQTANDVEIIKGLNTGEVIVTIGAYQVKMQSMSGQAPAHGHAH